MPLTKYDLIRNDSTNTLRTAAVDISYSIADNYTDNHVYASLAKRDPLWLAIPLTILYASILIAGIVGNVVTCVVILRNKYLRTTTNYYLFSLAVSDLLLLIFGLPQEMYYIWSR